MDQLQELPVNMKQWIALFPPHCFRHSFATHLIENGINVFALKSLLGHSFLNTTLAYVKCSMEFSKEEYKKAHEFEL